MHAVVHAVTAGFPEEQLRQQSIVLGNDIQRVHDSQLVLADVRLDLVIACAKTDGRKGRKYIVEHRHFTADFFDNAAGAALNLSGMYPAKNVQRPR